MEKDVLNRSPPLEDYWQEFDSFEENGHAYEDDDEAAKTPDECEVEEEWLREAGFETLVNNESPEDQVFNGLLSTLTTRQRDVVLKRLQSLELSKKKKKHRNRQRADVRQVFNCQNCDESLSSIETEKIDSLSETPLNSMVSDSGFHSTSENSSGQRASVFKETVRATSHEDVPKTHTVKSSSVLPQFLRTSHSGGFSLKEHMPLDSDGPTSVEVLRYETRTSIIHDKNPLLHGGVNAEVPEISFQEISSKLDPCEKLKEDNGECVVLTSNLDNYLPMSELSEDERSQVRSLAVIEVAALLDSIGIAPPRRRKRNRKKGKENVVFGSTLTALLELDRRRCPKLKIPLVYQWILQHLHEKGLKEEGLMRLAGSIQKIEALKAECEKYYVSQPASVETSVRNGSVYDVSVLLKQLIRQLPEPLLSNSHMDTFLQVPNIPTLQDQISALNLLVLALPDVHRELLQELLFLLSKISENEKTNRMSLSNVAMIMAPNLFPPPPRLKKNHHKNNDLAAEVTIAALSSKVTQCLIKYSDFLGMVPKQLLIQAQLQSQFTSKKHVKRSRGKKTKSEKLNVIKDAILSSNGHGSVIRVQFPSVHCLSAVPVTINERTTAADVIQKVVKVMDLKTDLCSQVSEQQENKVIYFNRPRTESEPAYIHHKCLFNAKNSNDCLRNHSLYYSVEHMGEKRLHHDDRIFSIQNGAEGRCNLPSTLWIIRCNH